MPISKEAMLQAAATIAAARMRVKTDLFIAEIAKDNGGDFLKNAILEVIQVVQEIEAEARSAGVTGRADADWLDIALESGGVDAS